MMPAHHVPDELLLEYVTGAASELAALAVACHLTLCPACAARAHELEAVGGAWLEQETGAPTLAPGALEAVMDRLDEPLPARYQPVAPPVTPPLLAPLRLPQPLLAYLTRSAAAPEWRFLVPGVRVIDLPVGLPVGLPLGPPADIAPGLAAGLPVTPAAPGAVARLVAFKGGVKIPHHDHGGPEYIIVFAGALEEKDGRFDRGDISVRSPGERHEQLAVPGETCVSLVINEGPLLPLTLRGRLLLALAGH